MLGFGMWCEGITNTGNRFAINQHIGGTGDYRSWWEPGVISTHIT